MGKGRAGVYPILRGYSSRRSSKRTRSDMEYYWQNVAVVLGSEASRFFPKQAVHVDSGTKQASSLGCFRRRHGRESALGTAGGGRRTGFGSKQTRVRKDSRTRLDSRPVLCRLRHRLLGPPLWNR